MTNNTDRGDVGNKQVLMGLILSSDNVVDFLKERGVCPPDFTVTSPIVCKESRNFNLVVKGDRNSYLIKQKRVNILEKISGQLITEWLVQELINNFSGLAFMQKLISQVLLFDYLNSTIVLAFYDDYLALDEFYETRQIYDYRIASTIGSHLAKIHRATYQQQPYQEFISQYIILNATQKQPAFISKLNSPSPSLFAEICPDGLDFYRLYQRFPSLDRAVIELYDNVKPACITHNDLTLDNFIIDPQIDFKNEAVEPKIKIIDWELLDWGDPAIDLGMLVSQYLGEWLDSLVADRNLDLNTTLRLASCPLEKIAPSLKALLHSYLARFPEILIFRSDFVSRIVQFAGIGILDRMSYYIRRHDRFHNGSLCKLQVAKNLLCNPQQGILTLFDTTEAELIKEAYKPTRSPLSYGTILESH